MNAKEKKSLELLFAFVRKNYKEILNEEYSDVSYKNIDAAFLAKARRKITAFLKYIGEREFRGCVYGKNNVRLIIRLFLQTYLMENAKTERLKKLIKKYEEYKK